MHADLPLTRSTSTSSGSNCDTEMAYPSARQGAPGEAQHRVHTTTTRRGTLNPASTSQIKLSTNHSRTENPSLASGQAGRSQRTHSVGATTARVGLQAATPHPIASSKAGNAHQITLNGVTSFKGAGGTAAQSAQINRPALNGEARAGSARPRVECFLRTKRMYLWTQVEAQIPKAPVTFRRNSLRKT